MSKSLKIKPYRTLHFMLLLFFMQQFTVIQIYFKKIKLFICDQWINTKLA